MAALRITVAVVALALAGCAGGEPPALAPGDPGERGDPYFLKKGFMGGFENRVLYAPYPAPRSASSTAASPAL